MNRTQSNLALLEARLALRTQEWIKGKLSDELFFPKLNNILFLANNKQLLKRIRLDRVFRENGTILVRGKSGLNLRMFSK